MKQWLDTMSASSKKNAYMLVSDWTEARPAQPEPPFEARTDCLKKSTSERFSKEIRCWENTRRRGEKEGRVLFSLTSTLHVCHVDGQPSRCEFTDSF